MTRHLAVLLAILAGALALVPAALAAPAAVAAPTAAAAPAVRIVSLSPTATESLFAIGAGKQVVAVDDQSSYPAAAPRTKLSGLQSSAEAIVVHDPDLVIIQFDPGGLVKALDKVGVKVLIQPSATTLAQAYGQIAELGTITGRQVQAARVVAAMKSGISKAVSGARTRIAGLKVYYELDNTYYSATSKTFIGQLLRLLGVKNVADAADAKGTGYPQLSAEYIVSTNPDAIVLADGKCCRQNAATVAARVGWKDIAAVRHKAVIVVDDDIASRWGPRTVALVRTLAERLAAVAPKTR